MRQIPANSVIDIENPRGDVSVTAGDGPNVEVQAHEVAYASSDSDAKKIFDAEAAQLKVSGNAVLIKSDEQRQRPGEPDGDGAQERASDGECRQGRCDRGRTGRGAERERGARGYASELRLRVRCRCTCRTTSTISPLTRWTAI